MSKLVSFLVVAALLAGCGGSTPSQPGIEQAHVRGTVIMNGQPIAGAVVTTTIAGTAFTGSATSDAAGRFCIAVPTFSQVVLNALYVQAAQVHAVSWVGSATSRSGDFGPCDNAPESEIVLQPTPI